CLGNDEITSVVHVFEHVNGAYASQTLLKSLKFLPESWPDQEVVKAVCRLEQTKETESKLCNEFSDVFDEKNLKPMKGSPMTIILEDNAIPHQERNARNIPVAYEGQVKKQLDDMLDDVIIERVVEPSAWCHPIVVVNKKGTSEIRMTVDLKKLNSQLESEVAGDETLQDLRRVVEAGFPQHKQHKNDLHQTIQPYWYVRNHLSVDDNVILKGQRLVIPKSLRRQVLNDLHASHQGQERTKHRARILAGIVKQCPECRSFQASQPKEPLTLEPTPELPFQSVSADLFSHCGWEYIVYVDRMSGWPCFDKLGRTCDSSSFRVRYNRSSRALKALVIGTRVDIQDPRSKRWMKTGVVVGIGQRRDYYVKTPSGAVYWRNRRFLRPLTSAVNPLFIQSSNHGENTTLNNPSITTPRRSQRKKKIVQPFNIKSLLRRPQWRGLEIFHSSTDVRIPHIRKESPEVAPVEPIGGAKAVGIRRHPPAE
ncbi:hypothetical protein TCAL_12397, partial [Tigriopus californicus]